MLTNWYGMASYCQDSNGFCRHTGGYCRPVSCPLMVHTYIPDDEDHDEQERTNDND